MDDEKEKIKGNSNTNKEKNNHNNINKKEKCQFPFSIQLICIRFMLISVFCVFCYYLSKLKIKKNISEGNIYESPQLINKDNIKIIPELNISINIEHSKYVHLTIKDKNNERWEVPKEILNSDYFNENKDEKDNNNSLFKMEIHNFDSNNFSFILYLDDDKDNITENKDNNKKIFYTFNTLKNFLFSNNYINFESHLTSDDIYGFGERIHNFKLKEGIYTIWPRDQKNYYDNGKGGKNLYGHQPIGLHKTKYKDIWLGFVFLNSNPQDVEILKKYPETILTHKTIGGIIDYYIIVDNSPDNILRDIHYLIGIPILPPYWSLGIHQCRWGYKNDIEFINVYKNYKSKEISIDAMWIDIDSMADFQIFSLNDDNFSYLPNYVENTIHKDHGKFVPIIDIGISYNEENLNKYAIIGDKYNLFIKSGYTHKNLMAKVWPGLTVFPDFFNPQINKLWDVGLNDYYEIIKYDGIWLDMNEPSNLNIHGICPGEIFEEEDEEKKYEEQINKNLEFSYLPGYKNKINCLTTGTISMNALTYNNILYNNKPLISVYQARQTYNYLKNINKRPFILTRANSFGIGKYSFHWLGDNFSLNNYIEYSIAGIFNYNIFGIPFTGADICGFNKNANGILCARWYNIGAFYPFSRNHNSKKYSDQYPWTFGEKFEKIIKKDIQYRYSLLRYYYSQLFLISLNEKGSFFKPVMFEYPNDMYSYEDVESKVMIGDAFLICVFIDNEENDKEFILPNSHFNLYPSGQNVLNYSSENSLRLRRKKLSGKLSELHIFLRGGYIIPMQDTFKKYILNSYYLRKEKINLIINPDNEGNSKGVIFYDNDENDVIEENKYIRVDLEFKNKALNIITNNKNLKYMDNDCFIGKIEIWRINEILDISKNTQKKEYVDLNIDLIDKKNLKIKGIINSELNKMIIDFEKNNSLENVNLFMVNKIYL